MTQFYKGKAGATLATVGGVIITALTLYSQIEEIVPQWFEDEDPYVEFSKHFNDEPQIFEFMTEDGNATVSYYPSDGCFLLDPPGADSRWVTRHDIAGTGGTELFLQRPVLAGFVPQPADCLTQGCLLFHDGTPADTWLGQRVEDEDGSLWTEVYREWPDGCVHFQLRREDGRWDVEADGKTPKVCWQHCVH